MVIGWPQGILLTIYLLSTGMSLADSVRNKDAKWIGSIIGTAVNIGLLIWGGFFG